MEVKKDQLKVEKVELTGKECLLLRSLWEEVFSEDSQEFTDYYFREKALRNRGFALKQGEKGDGREEYVSMLYLSPYEMLLRAGSVFESTEINYIVGVATKKEYRHRGCMDRLLKAALGYLYDKKQPFTFLMPADPKIYEPYQFTYIYDREEWEVTEEDGKKWRGTEGEEKDIAPLAEYASGKLTESYDVFMKRDEQYYRVMRKELKAQRGGIYISTEEDGINGYFLYTGENGKIEIQEAVKNRDNRFWPLIKSGKTLPVIMARIIDLHSILMFLRAEEGTLELAIGVQDKLLPGNEGIWQIQLEEEETRIKKYEKQEKEEECSCSIEKLTAWVFGYSKTRECFSFPENISDKEKEIIKGKLDCVKRWKNIWINEIV